MSFAARLLPFLASAGLFAAGDAVARSATDSTVQKLANFPALQKIAARGNGPTRAYVRAVSTAYHRAGYDDFTPEFRRSAGKIIERFASKNPNLKAGRAALRRLQRALDRDKFYVLPAHVGERIPNYRDLATVFLTNAKVAFKNISLGQPAGRKLPGKRGTLWLKRTDTDTVVPTGSYSGSVAGSVTITGIGGFLPAKNLAFPPGVDLPLDINYSIWKILTEPENIANIDFPAGTRFIAISPDFVAPPETAELPSYLGGTWSWQTNTQAWGVGSGTLYPGSWVSLYTLVGATVTLGLDADHIWIAFPPDSAIPETLEKNFLLLGRAYNTSGIDLPTGTRIAPAPNDYVIPEGAIALPSTDFTLEPLPLD